MNRGIHIKPLLSPNVPDDREWWEYTATCFGSTVTGRLPGTKQQAEEGASATLERLEHLSRNHDSYNWGSQFGTSNTVRGTVHVADRQT